MTRWNRLVAWLRSSLRRTRSRKPIENIYAVGDPLLELERETISLHQKWGQLIGQSLPVSMSESERSPTRSSSESESVKPTSSPVTSGAPKSEAVVTKDGVVFQDNERIQKLLGQPTASSGIAFIDPQCDEPLDQASEKAIESMTPFGYLNWICATYSIELNQAPANEWEARRAARKCARSIPSYKGERYIQ